MKPSLFQLGQKSGGPSVFAPIKQWLKEEITLHKLDSAFGYIFLSVMAWLIALLIGKNGLDFSIMLFAIVVLVPVLVGTLFDLRFGISMMLVTGFLIMGLKRILPEINLEAFLDSTLVIMLFGLFMKQSRERDWRFAWNPISGAIIIWIAYSLFELTNPWARSNAAWYYAMRSLTGIMFLFFVALYSFRDMKSIRSFVILWMIFATIGGLYGIYQELYGLQGFEWRWLMEEYSRFEDFSTLGRIRKFSFFSDPGSFGLIMGVSSLVCMGLIFGSGVPKRKITLLAVAAVIMLVGMFTSGTRTAFLVLPAGFAFLTFLTLDKRLFILGGVGLVIVVILVFIPSQSYNLVRFRSTFHPTETTSFQTRMQNHEFIQPYIRSRPIGIGIGSTGVWGQKFSPDTMLSQFPPDSGYVRIAVETGWIGLFLYMGLIFTILAVGTKNYFSIKDPHLKRYQGVFLSAIFAIALANFPQQALSQLPTSIIFYLLSAAVVKIRDFE